MSLESQLCSLEYSKKLKEAGIKQDSVFYWEYNDDKCYGIKYYPYCTVPTECNGFTLISAFTIAELMELLPAFLDTKSHEPFNGYWLTIHKRRVTNIKYIAAYYCDTFSVLDREPYGTPLPYKLYSTYDTNLADCLARMLVKLIDNKYIEIINE